MFFNGYTGAKNFGICVSERNLFELEDIQKPISVSKGRHEPLYAKKKKVVCKDIERCFGVLQAHCFCLRMENKLRYIGQIMKQSHACILLHNMIMTMYRRVELEDGIWERGNRVIVVLENLLLTETIGNHLSSTNENSDGDRKETEEVKIHKYMVLNDLITSREVFKRLRNGLIQTISNRGE